MGLPAPGPLMDAVSAPPVGQPAWAGTLAIVGVTVVPLLSPTIMRVAKKVMRPRKCTVCLGVGNNLCPACRGRGKQGGLFTGEALVKCALCAGRGRQLCTKCMGGGLANGWLYKPAKDGGWGPRGS